MIDRSMNDRHGGDRRVLRSDSPDVAVLEAGGWRVVARSWAAGLDTATADRGRLELLVERARTVAGIRELTPADADAVLALDAATLDDYPGDVATAHAPLTAAEAVPHPGRRGWAAFEGYGRLVAMTFLAPAPEATETDFTVVADGWRGLGLGSAVKAAAVLALLGEGFERFRTGGAAENAASLAANRAVGYVVDEEWLTLAPPEA
jgi:GNAT superfamily N-acetyltransferase